MISTLSAAPARARLNDYMQLQAGSDYAIPTLPLASGQYGTPPDFESVTGTITFPANDGRASIDIPIFDYYTTNTVEFNKDLLIELGTPENYAPWPADYHLGHVRTCVLTILFNNLEDDGGHGNIQPAGAVDRTHNKDDDSGTDPAYNLHPGANSTVYAVAVQPDGNTVLAGDFTAFNTTPRNRIARMLPNGQIDAAFDPADGADQFISSLVLDPTNNIIIAGAFDSFNRFPRSKIARLLPDGALDPSFFPGLGANGTIWQVALQNDGKLLIVGEFTTFNQTNRNHIARLNSDGSLDPSFDPGLGPDGPVYSVAVQVRWSRRHRRRVLLFSGTSRSCIARLNPDGSLDTSFNPRSGADGDNPAIYTVGSPNRGCHHPDPRWRQLQRHVGRRPKQLRSPQQPMAPSITPLTRAMVPTAPFTVLSSSPTAKSCSRACSAT